MKVSLVLCVCLTVMSTHLAGCGAPAEATELDVARTNGAQENVPLSASASAEPSASAPPVDCPDLTQEDISCGQIGITLKGLGSSCQLAPTANDLTRPPRSVRFDCGELEHGPNGYDYDELGHITLMGDTCAALQKGGAHRVTLILSCPPR
jgi:hypothetical protein